ncbi:MAG: hypothetical protein ACSLFR_16235 [Solirubrobacteraceae bacterium]
MLRRLSPTLLACALAWAGASPASAVISDAQTLEGPSADLVEVGGVAMAEDGTGGVVYVKAAEEGRNHVYAAQFVDGTWRAPQRVDIGTTQRFASSWPAIAAGNDGRLLVVWVQEFGDVDRMYSAYLGAGARRFQPPIPIDLNVGDSALGVYPSVSMNRGGQAYVAYRVITDAEPSTAPPGMVLGELRLARFTGEFWSQYGIPLNRNPAAPQRRPALENAPKIRTDLQGNAVLAWQESDDAFVDRIYARRIFPSTTGIALQVSPADLGGPLRGNASQFDLDVSGFGQAAIAYRQEPAQGSPLGLTPRLLVAEAADVFQESAKTFGPAVPADGGIPAGQSPGAVAVAVAEGGYVAAFGIEGQAVTVASEQGRIGSRARLGSQVSALDPVPVVDLAPSGAAAFAWRFSSGGRGFVTARERRPDGVVTDKRLTEARGGAVRALRMAGSGAGDGLVTFLQGEGAAAQVVAASIDAPPETFTVQTPVDFTNERRRYDLRWDPAVHAIGGVRYTITVDDDTVAENLGSLRHALRLTRLDDGVRTVQVVAVDSAGQETTSVPAELKLDRRAPVVRWQPGRGRVRIVISDGPRGQVSGVDTATVRMVRGGKTVARGRRTITKSLPRGRHRLTIVAADRAGNRRRVTRAVRIR